MVRIIATLLLMLQLRPVAEAAAACAVRHHPAAACDMAMPPSSGPAHDGPSHHSAPSGSPSPACDCPAVLVCTGGAVLALPSVTGGVVAGSRFGAPVFAAGSSPHTNDPAAPPVPPPNS